MMADDQPTFIAKSDKGSRIIVIGDVHGDVKRFMNCLYHARVFSRDLEWIAEPANTIVVQLGDQIDSMSRMPDGEAWEELADVEMLTLTDMLDKTARLGGGRLLSIVGNHEFMNIIGDYSYVSPRAKQLYDIDLRRSNFKNDGVFTRILAKRNLVLQIGDFLFCHGGILPSHLTLSNESLHRINEVFRRSIKSLPLDVQQSKLLMDVVGDQGIIWTRFYIEAANTNEEDASLLLSNVLSRLGCVAMFVGHSTVPSVTSAFDNRMFFVDAGLSRSFGNDSYQYVEIINNSLETHTIQGVEKK